MRSSALLFVMLPFLVACGGAASTPDAATASSDAASGGDAGAACVAAPSQVVSFTTDDGVRLEADLVVTGEVAGPVAVLLHMVPPSNDRSNYPPAFIEALASRGVSVLNVDRRGAGGSEGVARDAYQGPSGWLDASAALAFLAAHPCAFSASRTTIVGASNGTTTAIDYAVLAEADARPARLVLLTPGGYTESQHRVREHLDVLGAIPTLWVYSSAERAFGAAFDEPGASASWTFLEYEAGDHGTRMFTAVPESIERVTDWIAAP